MRQQRAPNAGNFSEWQRGVCLTFHTPASVFIRASIKELIKCLCWIISLCPKENLNELGKLCWKFIDFISISSWIVWSFSLDFILLIYECIHILRTEAIQLDFNQRSSAFSKPQNLIDFWKQTFNFDLQNAPNYFEINLFHLPNKVVTANKSHWIRKQFAIDRIGIENSKKYWQVHRQDILNALTICLCHSNEEQEQQKKKDREGEEWHSMRAWALCPQLRSVSKVFCATAKDCA